MRRRGARAAAAAAMAAALLGGCGHDALRARADAIRAEAGRAHDAAGIRCAPRELALAEAHLDFAERELADGSTSRAEEHLALAEQSARRAADLSQECRQRVAQKPAAPPPRIVRKVQDTDGDGVPDDIDRCPLDPEDKDGLQDEDGCPDPDNDGDGIVDAMDACPNNPGPLENRGCPVLDRDGDGVPDDRDRCPDQAGTATLQGCPDRDRDGVPDVDDKCPDDPGMLPDGCPRKYKLVEVRRDRIEIRQQVKFASGKYAVLPQSAALLDQVAQVLRDYPRMKVRIEGHTDNVGKDAQNLTLSQKRATSVKAWLAKKGIDPARLEAKGLGPTRPIASNRTEKGRAQNRRTEFHIVSLE